MIFESAVCPPWGTWIGCAPRVLLRSADRVTLDSDARHVLPGGRVPTTTSLTHPYHACTYGRPSMSTKPHTTIPITLHTTIPLIPIFPYCHISIFHAHYSSFLSLPTSLTTFLHLHGDSAHEKLATTTQVQGRFMPVVQEKPTVELVRVPNEMKIFKAYSKLRVV